MKNPFICGEINLLAQTDGRLIRVSLTLAFWTSTELSAELLSLSEFFPNIFRKKAEHFFLKMKQTNKSKLTCKADHLLSLQLHLQRVYLFFQTL